MFACTIAIDNMVEEIQLARKRTGNDPEEVATEIFRAHRLYGARRAVWKRVVFRKLALLKIENILRSNPV